MSQPQIIMPHTRRVVPITELRMIGKPKIEAAGAGASAFGFNPLDKNANITLSGSDLVSTQTAGAGAYSGVRSVTGHATGKWYAETLRGAIADTSSSAPMGIGLSSGQLNNYTGSTIATYGYFANGQCWHNAGLLSFAGNTISLAEYARVALDMDAAKLWFGDSVGWCGGGDPEAGTLPTYSSVPAGTYFIEINTNAINDVVTLNTGQGAFNYTRPASFAAWG